MDIKDYFDHFWDISKKQTIYFLSMSWQATIFAFLCIGATTLLSMLALAEPVYWTSKPNLWWHGVLVLCWLAWSFRFIAFTVQTDNIGIQIDNDTTAYTGSRGLVALGLMLIGMTVFGYLGLPLAWLVIFSILQMAAFVLPNLTNVGRSVLLPVSLLFLIILAAWIPAVAYKPLG